GETLPGVNILVKGTTTGTSTDDEGNFVLDVSSLQDTLVVSFIGYQTKEVPINGRTAINIQLTPEAIIGEQMVVIGFGEVERSDLTGSVSSIDAETFQNQSMTQLTNMLSGTIAGVNITQGTSASGGGGIQIRGRNSLTAGSSPMVVVDGAIYSGSLRTINPADIENIDVLKGASAAAIYGSRAASGVILVTTKKGTVGKPVINVTTEIGGTQSTNNNYGVRGPEDYIRYRQAYLRRTSEINPDYYYSNPNDLPEGVTLTDWRNANPNPIPDNTQEFLSRLNFFPIEREAYVAGDHINWY